jgi:hypothetical protein
MTLSDMKLYAMNAGALGVTYLYTNRRWFESFVVANNYWIYYIKMG